MKCTNCGSEVAPNQSFCSTCGTPVAKETNYVHGNNINQNLGGQADFQPPRKKGGVPIWVFLITILLIIAIILGAYFLIVNISDSDDDSSSSSSSRKKNNSDDDDDDDDDYNKSVKNSSSNKYSNNTNSNNTINRPTSDSNSTYTVPVGSFTLKIPTNYIYKVSGETVSIADEADTVLIRMQIKEAPYSTIVTQKDALASKMRESGAVVSKVEEKTINGTQCVVYEITESGQNFIMALVKINSMYTALCEIGSDDVTKYDYDGLENAISIAKTAEKSSGTTSTTTPNNNSSATTSNLEFKSSIDLNNLIEN